MEEVINGELCTLFIYDVPGGEEYRTIRTRHTRPGYGFIIVYSISSRNSFDKVKQFYDEIHQQSEEAIITIVGNKDDLPHERKVSTLEGIDLATKLGCAFGEASAIRADPTLFLKIAYQLKQSENRNHKSLESIRVEEQRSRFDSDSDCHVEARTSTWVKALRLKISSLWKSIWSCTTRTRQNAAGIVRLDDLEIMSRR